MRGGTTYSHSRVYCRPGHRRPYRSRVLSLFARALRFGFRSGWRNTLVHGACIPVVKFDESVVEQPIGRVSDRPAVPADVVQEAEASHADIGAEALGVAQGLLAVV